MISKEASISPDYLLDHRKHTFHALPLSSSLIPASEISIVGTELVVGIGIKISLWVLEPRLRY